MEMINKHTRLLLHQRGVFWGRCFIFIIQLVTTPARPLMKKGRVSMPLDDSWLGKPSGRRFAYPWGGKGSPWQRMKPFRGH